MTGILIGPDTLLAFAMALYFFPAWLDFDTVPWVDVVLIYAVLIPIAFGLSMWCERIVEKK